MRFFSFDISKYRQTPCPFQKKPQNPALGYCTLTSLSFVCSVISLQEVLYINMEIAMIYSERTLLPALTALLQVFQNKNFEKGEKGPFAAIRDLAGQQKWENKKENKEATRMEFLDLCFTGSVDFSLYVQVQKIC